MSLSQDFWGVFAGGAVGVLGTTVGTAAETSMECSGQNRPVALQLCTFTVKLTHSLVLDSQATGLVFFFPQKHCDDDMTGTE